MRLTLLNIGLNIHITKWIMVCATGAQFVVMINGYPLDFFQSSVTLIGVLIITTSIHLGYG
ncbi:hypothetical protein, partial [Bacteroides uniformis]|uniref:hypothetical protein n=1 Tax=Bacteroides uniformis TaxID=820 RepID=UPI001AA1051F